jgi:UDP-N-acetylmuramoylalanine--D-glutamate ligase
MQNYVNAKFRILQNQTEKEAFIFWNDDPIIAQEIAKRNPRATCYPFSKDYKPGLKGYTKNNQVIIETSNGTFTMEQGSLSLSGTHNLYNSLAAGIAAKLLAIPDEKIRKSLSDFAGVEHRLEKVLCVHGVEFINDSKATNVNSCWYALQSMKTKIVLILGQGIFDLIRMQIYITRPDGFVGILHVFFLLEYT